MLITHSDTSQFRYSDAHNHEADEYIIKPFRYPVLLKSIESQLRQFRKSEDTQYNIGSYVFKPNSKILESNKNRSIRLTEKENDILKFLYQKLKKL